mgnify:CR=1 FL=1
MNLIRLASWLQDWQTHLNYISVPNKCWRLIGTQHGGTLAVVSLSNEWVFMEEVFDETL